MMLPLEETFLPLAKRTIVKILAAERQEQFKELGEVYSIHH